MKRRGILEITLGLLIIYYGCAHADDMRYPEAKADADALRLKGMQKVEWRVWKENKTNLQAIINPEADPIKPKEEKPIHQPEAITFTYDVTVRQLALLMSEYAEYRKHEKQAAQGHTTPQNLNYGSTWLEIPYEVRQQVESQFRAMEGHQ